LGVANHPSSALPDRFPPTSPALLPSVPSRFRHRCRQRVSFEATARLPGPSRWHRCEPKLPPGHQDPASPGVRDLSAPPPTSPARVHFPALRVAPGRLRADGTTRPASFRPRGFAPPRRLSPRTGPRACCIPLPVLGFAAFR
jgi:hypothetical protein